MAVAWSVVWGRYRETVSARRQGATVGGGCDWLWRDGEGQNNKSTRSMDEFRAHARFPREQQSHPIDVRSFPRTSPRCTVNPARARPALNPIPFFFFALLAGCSRRLLLRNIAREAPTSIPCITTPRPATTTTTTIYLYHPPDRHAHRRIVRDLLLWAVLCAVAAIVAPEPGQTKDQGAAVHRNRSD